MKDTLALASCIYKNVVHAAGRIGAGAGKVYRILDGLSAIISDPNRSGGDSGRIPYKTNKGRPLQ